jgi:hypothetical protein
VRPGDGLGLPALPAYQLRVGERTNIRYLALPEGRESAPFIDALVGLASGQRLAGHWVESIRSLARPVDLRVFIAAACSHCPQAVRAALQLAMVSERVMVTVIDAQFFEELAGRYRVKSVPMTIIDGQDSFVGVISAPELARRVVSRDGAEGQARALGAMIEAGRFEDAADLLVAGSGLDWFLRAWEASTTQVRVSLLLTVEQALGRNPASLDGLVTGLLPLLSSPDAALRGDTADLLGQIGHLDAAGPLKALLTDPNPDVAEIAEESIDAIMERNG